MTSDGEFTTNKCKQTVNFYKMAGVDKKKEKRKYIAFPIRKKFQELISWKLLYTRLGAPNKAAAEAIDKEIEEFKATHGLD